LHRHFSSNAISFLPEGLFANLTSLQDLWVTRKLRCNSFGDFFLRPTHIWFLAQKEQKEQSLYYSLASLAVLFISVFLFAFKKPGFQQCSKPYRGYILQSYRLRRTVCQRKSRKKFIDFFFNSQYLVVVVFRAGAVRDVCAEKFNKY